jgi:hypothetical protein
MYVDVALHRKMTKTSIFGTKGRTIIFSLVNCWESRV